MLDAYCIRMEKLLASCMSIQEPVKNTSSLQTLLLYPPLHLLIIDYLCYLTLGSRITQRQVKESSAETSMVNLVLHSSEHVDFSTKRSLIGIWEQEHLEQR